VIRNIDRRLNAEPVTSRALMRPVEQLTELIGRMSLKDLVQDATTLIERLCIEAALEMTGDNRASAAELLGLSRQSLYQKLRRYGLGNLATEGDS
jgi:DNA-binding NtrC family response regulator